TEYTRQLIASIPTGELKIDKRPRAEPL
ncbi:hypothetical protein Xen7305DRAFT_00031290, partial [Xenococcus sp. PCC 7305]